MSAVVWNHHGHFFFFRRRQVQLDRHSICVTNLTVESKSRSNWQQQILYLNREALTLVDSFKFEHLHVLMLTAQDIDFFPDIMRWWWLNCSSFERKRQHFLPLLFVFLSKFIYSRHEYSSSGVDCHYFLHRSSIISCYRHKDTHRSVSYSSSPISFSPLLSLSLLSPSLFLFSLVRSLSMFVR